MIAAQPFPCPFCGTPAMAPRCEGCKRDPSTARRVCGRCKKQTPTNEPKCMHCGIGASSDMGWKIPVIIVMFVLVFILAVALQAVR